MIITGDCLEVMKTLDPSSIDAIVTDPPYGISFQSTRPKNSNNRFSVLENDDQPFVWFLRDAYRVLKPDTACIVFCRWDVAEAFRLAMQWAGFKIRGQLVWDRVVHGMGDLKTTTAPQHDLAWFGSKGRWTCPGKRPKSVYRSQRDSIIEHPTQKPVDLMSRIITDYTPPNGTILDPFCGSGSTGVAAIREGFNFIGIELNPEYAEIAKRRIEHEKEKTALLETAK